MELAKSRLPKLLKTLETKIVDGAVGEDSGSFTAGVPPFGGFAPAASQAGMLVAGLHQEPKFSFKIV